MTERDTMQALWRENPHGLLRVLHEALSRWWDDWHATSRQTGKFTGRRAARSGASNAQGEV